MKIVIAPDSFKGTMSAYQVACLIENSFRPIFPEAEMLKIPVADGGEGTMEALVKTTSGTLHDEQVLDPLRRPLQAQYGILGNGDAIVEMAKASGLALLSIDERDPLHATTYGTGQLIIKAAERGAKKILLTVGGSATVDGGIGLAQALGIRFFNEKEQSLIDAADLFQITRIDLDQLHPALSDISFEILCDVENPANGPNGAAYIYGRQKGATPSMIEALDAGIEHFANILEKQCAKKIGKMKGAGAGGAVALPLLTYFPTQIYKGIERVLHSCDFERQLRNCDLVITGEGKLDGQSIYGKAPIGVAQVAKNKQIPVIALCGMIGPGAEKTYDFGIDAYFSSLQSNIPEIQLIDKAPQMLTDTAAAVARLIRLWYG